MSDRLSSPRTRRMLLALFLFGAAFLVSMQSQMNPFHTTLGSVDSSVFHHVASVIDQGGLPYRDTFDHKGPLLYLINWLGLKLSYYCGAWFLELGILVGWNVLTYRTARLFCPPVSACAVVFVSVGALLTCFFGGNFPEVYALPCITGAVYIFTDYFLNQKITPLRLMLCGGALAAALMLKPNTIAVWAVFALAVLVQMLFDRDLRSLPRFLGFFLLGAAVVLLPIFAYLLAHGILTDFIHVYFLFNFLYSSAETTNSTVYVLQYFLFQGWAFASLAASVLFAVQEKEHRLFWCTSAAFVALSVLFCSLSGNTYTYYPISMVPCCVVPFANLLRGIRWKERPEALRLLVVTLAAVFALTWAAPAMDALRTLHKTTRELDLGDAHHRAIFELIAERTTPDDRIIVYGNEDAFYFFSHRFAASKYSFQYPIILMDTDIQAEFFRDLDENHPKLIIVQSLWCDDEYIEDFLHTHPEYVLLTDFDDYAVYQYEP